MATKTKRKATPAQLEALARGRAKRKRKTGLGAVKMPKTADILDGFKKAGLILVGFVGGREVSRLVVKDDESGFKRYLGSIIQLGGGVVLTSMKNEPLKYIGYGLTASGATEAVSKVLNKDIVGEGLLNGLSLGSLLSGKDIPAVDPNDLPPGYIPNLPPIEGDLGNEDPENDFSDQGEDFSDGSPEII